MVLFCPFIVLVIGYCLSSATMLRGPDPPWTTDKRTLLYKGKPFLLKGINFHGIESDCRVIHGLWKNPLKFYLDILQTLDFNSLRVPLSYEVMQNLSLPIKNDCVSADPQFMNSTVGDFLDSLLRLSWERGFSVLFDLHTIDGSITPYPWTSKVTEEEVVGAWRKFASRYGSHPALMGFEIKNEAHDECSFDELWKHSMTVVQAIESDRTFNGLYYVGGVGSNGAPWGGTYEGSSLGILLKAAPVNTQRIVFSPHVYGPDVRSGVVVEGRDIQDGRYGFLWDRAKLQNAIIVTEFGGRMKVNSSDLAYFEDWTVYLASKNMTTGGYFWTFPETSSDTGGILQGDDWNLLDYNKINFLNRLQPKPTKLEGGSAP